MYKSLFFAGAEGNQSREDIDSYRTAFGKEFSQLGFRVLDPTLGKDIDKIPLDELVKQDLALVDRSHIAVAYLPRSSEGSLREIQRAKENKILVYGFTDRGNPAPEEARRYLDDWFTDFDRLKRVLGTFASPLGEYFTTAHTNNVQGTVVLYGYDIHQVAPHHLHRLVDDNEGRANIYYFCAEKSHIHELAQKLPTILRLGQVDSLQILTKDGSPHDVQMHTLAEEVAENMGFRGNVLHYVVEKGRLYEVSRNAVRRSRHLSEIEATIPYSELVNLVAQLRQKCPNDRAETSETVLDHLYEEVKELKQAVLSDNIPNSREEAGDILYNLFLFSLIQEESGNFDIRDVHKETVRKMREAHKHLL